MGPVVSEAAAAAMAEGVCRATGSDVGLGITGVAGPDEQEGVAPGSMFVGLALPGVATVTREVRVPGDRERVRQYGAISALDLLRRALIELRLTDSPRRPLSHRRTTAKAHFRGNSECEPVGQWRWQW